MRSVAKKPAARKVRNDIEKALKCPPGCSLVQLKGKNFRIAATFGVGIVHTLHGVDFQEMLRLEVLTKNKWKLISISSGWNSKDVIAALRNLADALEKD